jgi:hypothetical protein
MRPLTRSEIAAVGGADTLDISLPAGMSVSAKLEANNSTTLTFSRGGSSVYSWNSGVWVSCHVIGSGVSIVGSFVNPTFGRLTKALTSIGCGYAATSSQSASEDGDG